MKHIIKIIFIVIVITNVTLAQVRDSTKAPLKKEDKIAKTIEKVFKYSPLPFAGYSTETSTIIGITKYNGFKIKSKTIADSLVQPSSVLLYAYYTMNNQYKIYTNIDLMHGDNKFNTKFEFLLLDYPSLYFGVGNDSKEDEKVMIDFKNILASPSLDYNFYEKMYIGAKYTFNNYINVKPIDTDTFNRDEFITDNEGIQSGFGFRFIREARDNRIRAQKGSYLFMSYDMYSNIIGSAHNYNSFIIDARKYITPIKQLTIAGQYYSEIKKGDVPIQSMALLGGTERMRGIYENRYRDNTLSMAQLELRFPLIWIISGVTFGGMGQVAPNFNDFTIDGFKYGYGAGLRLLIDEKTSSVLRFDISFRENGHSIFVGFNEAF